MAQTTPGGHGMGLRLDIPRDTALWSFPLAPLRTPPPSPIDLSPGFPYAVQNQGNEGACSAFAGCGALEWLLAAGDTPGTAVKLSEAFTYYQNRREDGSLTSQDTGASSQSIAKGMAQFGACPETLMPYTAGQYSQAPSAAALTAALPRRLSAYYQIAGDLLGGVWAILSAGIPCLMGFQVPESFETRVGSDGKVPAPSANDRILGGHEVVVCGWLPDSSAPGNLGWIKIRNSWGTGLGAGGFYLVPTAYWAAGLVMDHMVLAFATVPAPHPIPTSDARAEMAGICTEVQRIITAAQQTGWSTPQVQSDLGACWDYQAQLMALVEQTPLSNADQGTVKEYAAECQRLITNAQATGWTSAGVRSQLGSIKDYQNDILALLGTSPPDPTPAPSPQFVAPIPPGAIFGIDKWMLDGLGANAGHSMGCDMFCVRGTPVLAPADAVIEEVIGGTGLSGGAEIILATPDKAWAWRFRHVAAAVRVGQRVAQGQQIGTVNDTSLDMLCAPPVVGYPDHWQHADVSVCKGTDRFPPLGGGGGNYRASQWLTEIGYSGRQIARTPGPPSCGMAEHEASAFLLPFGRVAATLAAS